MFTIPETLPEALERFRAALLRATVAFLQHSDLEQAEIWANTPYAEGKWTRKQVLGHLIDSASNNHQRFVRGQLEEQIPFWPYAQDDWVHVQGYSERRWVDVFNMWNVYNQHLLFVMHGIAELDADVLERKFAGQTFTFGEVVRDYVRHLEHHLEQIFG
jgi:hypothetical protein